MAALSEHTSAISNPSKNQVDRNCPLNRNGKHKQISSQLLYPEKFTHCYQENSLLVMKDNSLPASKVNKTVSLPPSSVLSRLKEFLPQMVTSNNDLATQLTTCPENISKFDIENIQDSETHIEMNFSLVPEDCLGDSSDDECDDSVDSEDVSSDEDKLDIRLAKPKVKSKPVIQELNSAGHESSNK
ncbi:hypothetical protein Bpfe_029653 [Biomphalaria pfeifferi]|uniref:Uncharacterized protein n=1 Tax=Biomphalaria pfeifferi TaxID=112525 RepID=A0AAD8EVQ4_BIOPF|nr:hypothetical protein Bpfe_029653 [Biomphalaria pfeifferi]